MHDNISKTHRAKQLARQDALTFTTNMFQEAILEITNTKRILNTRVEDRPTISQGEEHEHA